MGTVWKVLTRKKVFDDDAVQNSQLARVLNTFGLTALGVGSTLGVGVYVIVGPVARNIAGPSVVLSFLIAAIASFFAGLCYSEFGARTPRAGSAYIYSYTCIGELVAFVIGWNLILEYVIGSASVAKGLSVYIDTLANDTLRNAFVDVAPINMEYMADYFDFFSFGVAILMAIGLAFGMKESSMMNNFFTSINIFVVLFVIIAGSMNADSNNWNLDANSDTGAGEGGFFPFGIEGMIKGAATCFYAFIGFDAIATTGEEVKNPKRAIPIAILVSLLICFLCYFGTATVVTMMVPFYAQDIHAPLPHAFAEVGWIWAKWIVAIGGIFGLFASLFGAMFPLPRILYAMASDGLIFRFLGVISNRFSSPVIGTLLAGVLTGLMSALFNLSQLVNMMSIGTLLAYTIVAACVLLLRFEAEEEVEYSLLTVIESESDNELYTDSPRFDSHVDVNIDTSNLNKTNTDGWSGLLKHIFGCRNHKRPTKFTEKLAAVYVTVYCFLTLILGLLLIFMHNDLANGETYAIVLTSVVGFFMILILMLLSLQPTTTRKLPFKVPLVPFMPALSILINIYLMLMLDAQTWIRFGVWMLVGVPMYIFLRLCCQSKQLQPEKLDKNTVNGEVTSNGHLASTPNLHKTNGIVGNGYNDGQASAPFEDYSEDSGFGSNAALEVEQYSADEIPSEIKPRKSLSTSVDAVISALDDVILVEETMQTAMTPLPERKLSIDTVSNGSYLPVEEKVVALVHRENEISAPTSPGIYSLHPSALFLDKAENNIETKGQNLPLQLITESKSIDDKQEERDGSNDKLETLLDSGEKSEVNDKETSEAGGLVFPDQIPVESSKIDNEEKGENGNESSTENPIKDTVRSDELTIKYSGSNSDDSPPVSLEDLHNERNESDTDIIDDTVPTIPVPPPMDNYENFKSIQIPRANFEKKPNFAAKEGVTIRPKPLRTQALKSPEPILNSRKIDNDDADDDNMVFGTDRHKAFKHKLEIVLGISPTQKKLTKPEQHEMELPKQSDTLKHKMSQLLGEIVRTSAIDNEETQQSTAQESSTGSSLPLTDDFKGKLSNILAGKSIRAAGLKESVPDIKPDDKNSNSTQQNTSHRLNTNDKDIHKGKMSDTFSRIKLRKVESFKEH